MSSGIYLLMCAFAFILNAFTVYANVRAFQVVNPEKRRVLYVTVQVIILIISVGIMVSPMFIDVGEGMPWILIRASAVILSSVFATFASGKFEKKFGRKWETEGLIRNRATIH